MSLHDELSRIADRAPVADVPDDLWPRARRSRRRAQVVAVGAAAAAVALTVGLVGLVARQDQPPVADSANGAVPDRIWAAQAAHDIEQAPDLAVGPVAAAYTYSTDGGERALVISARDGRYLGVRLPHFTALDQVNAAEQDLALSPDGSRLAYSWAGAPPKSGPTPTGVAIVDLDAGTIRSIPLSGGQGILVNRMSWSPDGRWLVWSGQVSTKWTRNARSFGDEEAAGLVAPAGDASTSLPANPDPDGVRQYAVGDDGTVAIVDGHRIAWWHGGEVVAHQPVRLGATYSQQAWVQDDRVRDLRMPYVVGSEQDQPLPLVTTHVRGGDDRGSSAVDDAFEGSSPLGFDGDGNPIAEVGDTLESNRAVWRITVTGEGAYAEKLVTEVDGSVSSLTVATAPPVTSDVTPPEWAASDGHSRWWWALGVGALGLLALVLILRRARAHRVAR